VVHAEAKVVRAEQKVAAAEEKARQASGALRELGSYRLVERLARGGMGELWRAEHRLLARPAAVKLITLEEGTTEEEARVASERFRREAKTLASLEARNTVQVFDYGAAEDGTLFLVMELLRGVDLERLVAELGPQPAARVIAILGQALSSLDEAHRAGLVHRDIKPANLFLSRAASELDVVKVVDFGLVRLRDEADVDAPAVTPAIAEREASAALTSKEGVLGTPACMAPEQVRNLAVDGRTDLYAIGCVGFFLLTGEHVFGTSSAMSTLVAHMTKKPRKPSALAKGWIPEELERAILSCLEKSPEKRPASAAELAALLRAIPIPEEHAWTDARARAWWAERDARIGAHDAATVEVPVQASATEAKQLVVVNAR
jgi:serine/threonine protein kinase